jgi:hypothetical protein
VAKAQGIAPLLHGKEIIMQGRRHEKVDLQVGGREKEHQSACAPWSFQVWYDKPRPSLFMAKKSHGKAQMIVRGMIAGAPADCLLDTGASDSFISEEFLKRVHIVPQGQSEAEVELATGEVTRAVGVVKLRTVFKSMPCNHSYYVRPTLAGNCDLILGLDFLRQYKSIINVADSTCTFWQRGRGVVVKAVQSDHVTPPCDNPVISLKQLTRCVRKGCPLFLGFINKTSPEPTDEPLVAPTPVKDFEPAFGPTNKADVSEEISGLHHPICKSIREEFASAFSERLQGLPPDRDLFHTIPLFSDSSPPARPAYRLSQPELQEAQKQIADLLSQGLIQPSCSPYSSPVLFVKKKDGTLRMVIDYRALNRITIQDRYPLPRIDDLLDKLQGASCFTSLDLLSGYHQIRLKEDDIPKTAFRVPFGHYEFKVLPFGLTNAPATFQRMMNKVFHDFIQEGFVIVYLDDVLIFSKSEEEHHEHLRRVFARLRDEQLFVKLKKCSFCQPELKYLRYIVGKDGIKIDPDKVAAVVNWPVPKNVSEVRQFLGLCNFSRKFVQGYSRIAAPLTHLLRKAIPWLWSADCQRAFDGLKWAITNEPVLAIPNPAEKFRVECDASTHGVGAILKQNGRPCAYLSRKFSDAEKNYHITEQELAAVCMALTEWRSYLLGQTFEVVTDHAANTFLPSQSVLSPREARWSELLQMYSIEWKY